jgi:hypothetical protein
VVEVRGSVIGAISPEDESSLSFTVLFATTGTGTTTKQDIPDTAKEFESKIGEEGSSAVFEPTTESAETLLDFPLKVEIMG